MSPRGINRLRCSRNPTISARTLKFVRGERTTQMSPSPTFGPSDSMISPATLVAVPTRSIDAEWRTCVRRMSTSGPTESFIGLILASGVFFRS